MSKEERERIKAERRAAREAGKSVKTEQELRPESARGAEEDVQGGTREDQSRTAGGPRLDSR